MHALAKAQTVDRPLGAEADEALIQLLQRGAVCKRKKNPEIKLRRSKRIISPSPLTLPQLEHLRRGRDDALHLRRPDGHLAAQVGHREEDDALCLLEDAAR